MKRGTGLSLGRKVSGESRGRAPEGERVSPKSARRDPAQRQRSDCAERSLNTRLSALRLPLGRPVRAKLLANLGAQTKSAAREGESVFTSPRARGGYSDIPKIGHPPRAQPRGEA